MSKLLCEYLRFYRHFTGHRRAFCCLRMETSGRSGLTHGLAYRWRMRRVGLFYLHYFILLRNFCFENDLIGEISCGGDRGLALPSPWLLGVLDSGFFCSNLDTSFHTQCQTYAFPAHRETVTKAGEAMSGAGNAREGRGAATGRVAADVFVAGPGRARRARSGPAAPPARCICIAGCLSGADGPRSRF